MEATVFVPIGLGLTVIGAGLGIGRFTAAAAEGIALLEGVAILAEVFIFLMLIL